MKKTYNFFQVSTAIVATAAEASSSSPTDVQVTNDALAICKKIPFKKFQTETTSYRKMTTRNFSCQRDPVQGTITTYLDNDKAVFSALGISTINQSAEVAERAYERPQIQVAETH